MGNLKKRVERLEGGRKDEGLTLIFGKSGETMEEARQRCLAENPELENAKMVMYILGEPEPKGES